MVMPRIMSIDAMRPVLALIASTRVLSCCSICLASALPSKTVADPWAVDVIDAIDIVTPIEGAIKKVKTAPAVSLHACLMLGQFFLTVN